MERWKATWSPPSCIVRTAEAKRSCGMAKLRMESRNTVAKPVRSKAKRIQLLIRIQKNGEKRSSEPIRSAAVYGEENERLEYHEQTSIEWMKKSRKAASAERNGDGT